MNKVFVISRYMGVKKKYHQFHFIGHYMGQRITRIYIKGGNFEVDKEYLLAIDSILVINEVLTGELIKSKEIF